MTVHLNQHGSEGFLDGPECDRCGRLATVWQPGEEKYMRWEIRIIRLCKTCLQSGIDEIDAAVLAAVKEKADGS